MARKTIYDDVAMYFKSKDNDYWKQNSFKFSLDILNLSYYLDIKPRIRESHFCIFNSEGIPLTKYGEKNIQVNPVNVCSFGLGCLDMYLDTNDKDYLDKFFLMANWLCDNQETHKEMGLWYYRFDWKKMKNPWISGMAQGEALSVLSRAYVITNNRKYLDCARKGFKCFTTDVVDGGVVSYLNGSIFFEEYPYEGDDTYVLNGFIYAMLGIIDYYIVSNDNSAFNTFQNAIKTLADNLYLYDNSFWSMYNISKNEPLISSYMYHNLHIVQLGILHEITNEKVYKYYYDKWEKYRNSTTNKVKALTVKMLEKLKVILKSKNN